MYIYIYMYVYIYIYIYIYQYTYPIKNFNLQILSSWPCDLYSAAGWPVYVVISKDTSSYMKRAMFACQPSPHFSEQPCQNSHVLISKSPVVIHQEGIFSHEKSNVLIRKSTCFGINSEKVMHVCRCSSSVLQNLAASCGAGHD